MGGGGGGMSGMGGMGQMGRGGMPMMMGNNGGMGGMAGMGGMRMQMMGNNGGIARGMPPPQMPMGGGGGGNGGSQQLWNCQMCSFQNSPSAAVCTMCQQGRPQQPMMGGSGGIMGGQGKMGGGQQQNDQQKPYWECQSCTFVNSIMSASCKICSNPQPKPQQPQQPMQQKQQFGMQPPMGQNMGGGMAQPPSYDDAMQNRVEYDCMQC